MNGYDKEYEEYLTFLGKYHKAESPVDVKLPVAQSVGQKSDSGKPRMGMLFQATLLQAVILVVRVLEFGAKKYPEADNWVKVEDGVRRYRDAALRHLAQRASGERFDDEEGGSKLPHMAHVAVNALFSLALEEAGK